MSDTEREERLHTLRLLRHVCYASSTIILACSLWMFTDQYGLSASYLFTAVLHGFLAGSLFGVVGFFHVMVAWGVQVLYININVANTAYYYFQSPIWVTAYFLVLNSTCWIIGLAPHYAIQAAREERATQK